MGAVPSGSRRGSMAGVARAARRSSLTGAVEADSERRGSILARRGSVVAARRGSVGWDLVRRNVTSQSRDESVAASDVPTDEAIAMAAAAAGAMGSMGLSSRRRDADKASAAGPEDSERKKLRRRARRASFTAGAAIAAHMGQRQVRSLKDRTELYTLLKDTSFFQQLPAHVGVDLCKHMSHQVVDAEGTVLCYEKTKGRTFYILLAGSVDVHVLGERSVQAGASSTEEVYGPKVATLVPPFSFGERALLSDTSLRTSTCVASAGTELLVLDYTDFDQCLRRVGNVLFMPERLGEILAKPPVQRNRDELQLTADILKNHNFFQQLDARKVLQLCSKLRLKVCEPGSLIFKENDEGNHFYIVLQGAVVLCQPRRRARPSKQSIDEHASGLESAPGDGFSSPDQFERRDVAAGGGALVGMRELAAPYGRPVSTLLRGDSFGDRALIQRCRRDVTALAAEHTQLMVLQAHDFRELFRILEEATIGIGMISDVLRIRPSERKAKDIDVLTSLTRPIEFFSQLDPEKHRAVCRAARYRKCAANEVVLRQGEDGSEFYVVLRGTVSVHARDSSRSRVGGLAATVLGAGKAFGELSLVYGQPRSASVIAQETTELLVLARAEYGALLLAEHAEQLERRTRFLRSFETLHALPQGRLVQVAYAFERRVVPSHSVLLEEDDSPSSVYVILSGECRMLRHSEMARRRRGRLGAAGHATGHQGLSGKRRQRQKGARQRSVGGLGALGNAVDEAQHGLPADVEVCTLSAGQHFGEYSVLTGEEQPFTVITTCTTEMLVCAGEEFRLKMADEQVMTRMREATRARNGWQLERTAAACAGLGRFARRAAADKARRAAHAGSESGRPADSNHGARLPSLARHPVSEPASDAAGAGGVSPASTPTKLFVDIKAVMEETLGGGKQGTRMLSMVGAAHVNAPIPPHLRASLQEVVARAESAAGGSDRGGGSSGPGAPVPRSASHPLPWRRRRPLPPPGSRKGSALRKEISITRNFWEEVVVGGEDGSATEAGAPRDGGSAESSRSRDGILWWEPDKTWLNVSKMAARHMGPAGERLIELPEERGSPSPPPPLVAEVSGSSLGHAKGASPEPSGTYLTSMTLAELA